MDNPILERRLNEVSSENYLSSLDVSVQFKSIVLMGEQDHGDGSAISLKNDIVKYLHENHGFNILIFESDYFSFLGTRGDSAALDNVHDIWNKCDQFNELEKYYLYTLSTDNPLLILGIDNIHFTQYRKANLVSFFNDVIGTNLPDSQQYLQIIEKFRKSGIFISLEEEEESKLIELEKRASSLPGVQSQIAHQELRNLISVSRYAKELKSGNLSNNIRDNQWFDNFVWLKENVVRDEKCIIWTTNSHSHKSFEHASHHEAFERDTINFGTLLKERYNDASYHIGFSSLAGSSQRFYEDEEFIESSRRSLEYFFYKRNNASPVFINFNQLHEFYSDSVFMMSPFGHFSRSGSWFNLFDALILIDEMAPCKF